MTSPASIILDRLRAAVFICANHFPINYLARHDGAIIIVAYVGSVWARPDRIFAGHRTDESYSGKSIVKRHATGERGRSQRTCWHLPKGRLGISRQIDCARPPTSRLDVTGSDTRRRLRAETSDEKPSSSAPRRVPSQKLALPRDDNLSASRNRNSLCIR